MYISKSSINAISMAASIAIGGGKVGFAIAGAGAVSTNAIRGQIIASVDGSTLDTQAGDITVDARSQSVISSAVLAVSAAVGLGAVGVGVGVGVSIAENYIGYDLQGNAVGDSGEIKAFINNSSVSAADDLTVQATGEQTINTVVFAGAVALGAGKVGVGIAGSGVDATNKIGGSIEAYIDGGFSSEHCHHRRRY